MKPGARRGPMPWRIAFSTSGCRIMFGTSAERVLGAMSISTCKRS